MDKVYVVMRDSDLIGVYTTHQKATQELLLSAQKESLTLKEHSFEFGIEYFIYVGTLPSILYCWEIHEVTPDNRT
jgi:hypothetical protein